MNKRANSTEANESPSRILEAALEPGQGVDECGEPRTEEQDKAPSAEQSTGAFGETSFDMEFMMPPDITSIDSDISK